MRLKLLDTSKIDLIVKQLQFELSFTNLFTSSFILPLLESFLTIKQLVIALARIYNMPTN